MSAPARRGQRAARQENGRWTHRRQGGAETAAAARARRSTRSKPFARPSGPKRRSVDDPGCHACSACARLRWSSRRPGRVPSAAGAAEPRSPAGAAGTGRRDYPKITLTAGRSTVLSTDFDITRIAVTNPTVADAVVVQPREILIDGKAPGTVSLIIWGAGGSRKQYDVVVDRRRARAAAAAADAVSRRGHPRHGERRGDDPVGRRVEQHDHAARRRDRRGQLRRSSRSSTCCSCPAATRASR